MGIVEEIKSISFDTNKGHGFGVKSAILWAELKEPTCVTPLLYISKPKWISQEEFEEVLDKLEIQMRR